MCIESWNPRGVSGASGSSDLLPLTLQRLLDPKPNAIHSEEGGRASSCCHENIWVCAVTLAGVGQRISADQDDLREGEADRCHCLHYREACVDHSSQTLMPSFDAFLMARSPSFSEKQGQSRLSCYMVYCVYWMQLYSKSLPMMKSYDCIYSAGMQKQGKGPRTV